MLVIILECLLYVIIMFFKFSKIFIKLFLEGLMIFFVENNCEIILLKSVRVNLFFFGVVRKKNCV